MTKEWIKRLVEELAEKNEVVDRRFLCVAVDSIEAGWVGKEQAEEDRKRGLIAVWELFIVDMRHEDLNPVLASADHLSCQVETESDLDEKTTDALREEYCDMMYCSELNTEVLKRRVLDGSFGYIVDSWEPDPYEEGDDPPTGEELRDKARELWSADPPF